MWYVHAASHRSPHVSLARLKINQHLTHVQHVWSSQFSHLISHLLISLGFSHQFFNSIVSHDSHSVTVPLNEHGLHPASCTALN